MPLKSSQKKNVGLEEAKPVACTPKLLMNQTTGLCQLKCTNWSWFQTVDEIIERRLNAAEEGGGKKDEKMKVEELVCLKLL